MRYIAKFWSGPQKGEVMEAEIPAVETMELPTLSLSQPWIMPATHLWVFMRTRVGDYWVRSDEAQEASARLDRARIFLVCPNRRYLEAWCHDNRIQVNRNIIGLHTRIDAERLRGVRLTEDDQVVWYQDPDKFENGRVIAESLRILLSRTPEGFQYRWDIPDRYFQPRRIESQEPVQPWLSRDVIERMAARSNERLQALLSQGMISREEALEAFGLPIHSSEAVEPGSMHLVNVRPGRAVVNGMDVPYTHHISMPSEPRLTPLGEIAYGHDTGGCWADVWTDIGQEGYGQCGKDVAEGSELCPEHKAELQRLSEEADA